MKRVSLLLAVVLCLTATARADININVPTGPVAVGQNVQIFVGGIEGSDLPKAIARHWPREQTTFVAAKTWGNQPFIWFEARLPGKYLIEITVPRLVDGEATLEHAEAVLVVGGEPEPQPNPIPDPVPPVPVPDQVTMAVIMETETRTGPETEMLVKLRAYLRTSGTEIRFVDQDLKSGVTNETPKWLKPYLKAVTTNPVTLPALVVLAQTPDSNSGPPVSSVVSVKALGGLTGAEVIELVQDYGG